MLTRMHVEIREDDHWEKFMAMSKRSEDRGTFLRRLYLSCRAGDRSPVSALPGNGWRLLRPNEVLEVVYHDQCAWRENNNGVGHWDNASRGAAVKRKVESGTIMASDFIGERRGQLEIPREMWDYMEEHRQIPKVCTCYELPSRSTDEPLFSNFFHFYLS